jgi:cysteine synthase
VPDDVSLEKVKALEVLGAHVEMVRPASIVDKKQASTLTSPTDCRGLTYFSTSVRGEYTAVGYPGKDC